MAAAMVLVTIPVQAEFIRRGEENSITLPMMNLFLPLLGALWGVFSLQDVLEEAGGEIYLTYHRSRKYWGLMRQARFFILYAAVALILCGIIGGIIGYRFSVMHILFYLCQGYFVMSLGFLVMTVTGHANDALTALGLYVCAAILFADQWKVTWLLLLSRILWGTALFALGNLRLKKR